MALQNLRVGWPVQRQTPTRQTRPFSFSPHQLPLIKVQGRMHLLGYLYLTDYSHSGMPRSVFMLQLK